MSSTRLYGGVVLLIAAMTIRAAWDGTWSTALAAVIGLILILASFSPEGDVKS